jgi:hypothetical protein
MGSRLSPLDFRAKEKKMNERLRRTALLVSLAGLVLLASPPASAGREKALVGSYTLAKRLTKDGKTLTGSELVGFMTFTKTRRTVIMRWPGTEAAPVSISFIAAYTLSGQKYCENVTYGVQSNLGARGVSYDTPSETKSCTGAISDASGLSFDVPNENLRFRVGRDGIIATAPGWTDYWERVK